MVKEICLVLMLSTSLTGCTLVHKSQTKMVKVMPPQKLPVEEKVWVEAKTTKIWVNPHVDENGDMIEGHYKYVITIPGHWAVKEDEKK